MGAGVKETGRVGDSEELRALLEGLPGRTLAAKLRRLLPAIVRRIKDGVQCQEIVDALNQHGGLGHEVRLTTLRSYLYRYRKAQQESSSPFSRQGREASAALRVPGVTPIRASLEMTSVAVTPSVLRQSREEAVDLEALAELGKSIFKRQEF